MAMAKAKKIWMNGKWVDWDDARSTSCRTSRTTRPRSSRASARTDPSTARRCSVSTEHVDRLLFSARVYRMEIRSRASSCARRASTWWPSTSSRSATSAPRLPRLREPRRQPVREPRRRGGGGVPVGAVPGPTRCRRACGQDRPRGTAWPPTRCRDGQGGGQLHELGAPQDGGQGRRLRRGHSRSTLHGFVSEGSGQNLFAVIQGRARHAAAGQQHPGASRATPS